MKTALQNVLDKVQKRLNEFDRLKGFEVTMMTQELNWFKNILIDNIEKEKEQIIGAINDWCNDDNILTPEQYYNETYNHE